MSYRNDYQTERNKKMKKIIKISLCISMILLSTVMMSCCSDNKERDTTTPSDIVSQSLTDEETKEQAYTVFCDLMNRIKDCDFSKAGSSARIIQLSYAMNEYAEEYKSLNDYIPSFAEKYINDLKPASAKRFARHFNTIDSAYVGICMSSPEVYTGEPSVLFDCQKAQKWGVVFYEFSDNGSGINTQDDIFTSFTYFSEIIVKELQKKDLGEIKYSETVRNNNGDKSVDRVQLYEMMCDIAYYHTSSRPWVSQAICSMEIIKFLVDNDSALETDLEKAIRDCYLSLDPVERFMFDYHLEDILKDSVLYIQNPDTTETVLEWTDDCIPTEQEMENFSLRKIYLFASLLTDISHVPYI